MLSSAGFGLLSVISMALVTMRSLLRTVCMSVCRLWCRLLVSRVSLLVWTCEIRLLRIRRLS